MPLLRLVPRKPNFNFIRPRYIALVMSIVASIGSLVLVYAPGLNFGIDFRGGTVIEVRMSGPADVGEMRTKLSGLGLGDVSLQQFGEPTDVLIRVQQQDVEDQTVVIHKVQDALGPGVEYRRTEFVGPTVGEELMEAGVIAVILSLLGITIYVWFRFEWQFAVGAILSLIHDVTTTVGLFALTGMEFNLSTVAAVLTVAGYSINDTVVIYDRVRENLRRYKRMSMPNLVNLSINETLSRTVMTALTTLVALIALALFGGEVIRGFCIAMIWGILIGTYSSVYLAVPALLWTNVTPVGVSGSDGEDSANLPARP